MSWPLSQDYNEAIQSPETSFADPDLKQGEVVCNALGIPMPRSGNFADVYEYRSKNGSRWAIKCFTRQVIGLKERYLEISRALQEAKLPFMVEFTYQTEGIRIRGQWYPILKMQWVEGLTFNEFVRQNLDKPAVLEGLLQIWGRMAQRLRAAGIAHADLQHGNVLFVPGSTATSLAVKLIDYDGMFVPTLADRPSGEVGHPSYQHPQRVREAIYNCEVDRFPLLLIATSLRCIRVGGRGLWDRYDNGDNLLFREVDLAKPATSKLFAELEQLPDEKAQILVSIVREALAGSYDHAPHLDEVLNDLAASTGVKTTRSAPSPPIAVTRSEPVAVTRSEPDKVVAVQKTIAKALTAKDDIFGFEDAKPSRNRRPRKRKSTATTLPLVWIGVGGGIGLILAAGIITLALFLRSSKLKQAHADPVPVAAVTPPDKQSDTPPKGSAREPVKVDLPKTKPDPAVDPQRVAMTDPVDNQAREPMLDATTPIPDPKPPVQEVTDTTNGPKSWTNVDLGKARLIDDFVRIPDHGDFSTTIPCNGPLEITVIARLKKTNIRIHAYRQASIIFNWEVKPSELRAQRPIVGSPIGTARYMPLEPDTWYNLCWRIGEKGMTVLINGEVIYVETNKGPYELKTNMPVTIRQMLDPIDVKYFSVRTPTGQVLAGSSADPARISLVNSDPKWPENSRKPPNVPIAEMRGPRIQGGPGDDFRDDAPANGVLIGIETGQMRTANDAIRSIRPIYLVDGKEVLGKTYGENWTRTARMVAKPGYAVGALRFRSGLALDGLSVVFMKLTDGKLDSKDFYESNYLGGPGGRPFRTEGTEGVLVVGLQGRVNRHQDVSALGLIYADTKD